MNRIRETRQAKGITQAELAKVVGVGQNTLSYWERDVYDIDTQSLQLIADYFGVSVDYILGRTDDHAPVGTQDITSLTSTGGLPPLEGVYLRLAREAQNMRLSQKDIDFILGVYKSFKEANETGEDKTVEK